MKTLRGPIGRLYLWTWSYLGESSQRRELFSRLGFATVLNNGVSGSAGYAAVLSGACGVRARMLFNEDQVQENGPDGALGITVDGAVQENCVEMVE